MSAPTLITRHGRAAEAAGLWRRQYGAASAKSDGKEKIALALEALGSAPEPSDVDAAIGNDSWTNVMCDGCDQRRLMVAVQVGQEPDYESSTAVLCVACLRAALSIAESASAAWISRQARLCSDEATA